MKEIELNDFRVRAFHNGHSQLKYNNRLITDTFSIFTRLYYFPDIHLIHFTLNISFLRDRYSIL